MALFLSSEIHQGDDLFSVQSRGKQCAFMSLSAVLTAQNIPLIDWSKTTLNNVLLQGDKMYLQALDNGFVVLEPSVEFLSVDNLPKVVSVSCCTNMFSYEICDSVIDTSIIPPVLHANTTTTHVDSFDAQNNVELPMVVGQNSNSLPVVVRQNNNSLPVVVRQNNNSLPVVVRRNNNSPPVVVGQNSNSLPVVVRQNNNSLPVVVRQNNNSLPVVVEPIEAQNIIQLPIVVEPIEAQNNIELPIVVEPVEAQNNIEQPIVVEPVEAKSITDLPIVAKSNTDLSIGVEHNSVVTNEENNKNQIWFINYGKKLQGLVITNREIESHYYDIHTALLNVFSNYSCTILILEGYMMALIKQTGFFYLFDSHARDSSGMPDPNGTAVVMKFVNILELEQYLYSVSMTLHANLFEIVPVQLNICKASEKKSYKCVKDREYVLKKRLLIENEGDKQARLKKASEYKKRKQSEETDSERQIRLQKLSESIKQKRSEETDSERQIRLQKLSESIKQKRSEETDSEWQIRLQKLSESIKQKRSEETDSERQIRLQKLSESIKQKHSEETDSEKQITLQKDCESKKTKRSEETDPNRQIRLQKDSESKKRKRSEETDTSRQVRLEKDRLNKKQKRAKKVLQPQHELNQQDYLNMFDRTNNGGIEEQCWAKANINKFNKSVQYIVSQCTECQEAWPLKSKPRTLPYVCSRCFRDKKSPKKFSCENSMIPSCVPHELQNLTQIEEMLIARALPIMRVYIKPGGQRGYSGHCINLPQNVKELAMSLPRYPKDLAVIIVKAKGRENTFRDVTVRKQKVHNALVWLINNNPHYSELLINEDALNSLPENGVPPGLMTVETDHDIISDDNCSPDVGPPTDNPSEDIVYNDSTEMSSFLPVGEQQQREIEAVRNQLSENEPMPWPSVENAPINEYQISHLATMAFPTLFPDGKGDPTNQGLLRDVPLQERIKHLLKFAEIIDGKWVYRFANHPRFSYWAFNMIQRKRILQQSGIFLKQNPGEAHLTIDELREMAASNNASVFMSKVSRYVGNIAGTNAYWNRVREELKAIITSVAWSTNIIFHFLLCRYALA